MILPPFAAPQGFKGALQPPETGEAFWYIFSAGHLLVAEDRKTLPAQPNLTLQRSLYMGTWNDKHLFAGEVEPHTTPPSGWIWSHLRPLYATLHDEHHSIAGRAMQLIYWDRSNRFCGHCGAPTVSRAKERCRECTSCGQPAYPKFSIAMLACIRRGDKILLATSPVFPEPFYSTLAGFVEPGETLEQCVVREVFEEVGLHVNNVQYYGSQPWPFSYSMMVGFTCDWEKGEIIADPVEISHADWFGISQLPNLPPQYSLSRLLIDHVVQQIGR